MFDTADGALISAPKNADWQRALYLSAFFGAEMSAPSAVSNTNFYAPTVSQNRRSDVADAGEQYLSGIADTLESLGIETNDLERFDTETEDTERLRFGVNTDPGNLIEFLSTVGFSYNAEKERKAALAVQYLRRKEHVIGQRARIASEVETRADGGESVSELKEKYDVSGRSRRSVRRTGR